MNRLLPSLVLALISLGWQYPPEYQPKPPNGAPQPPKTLTGSFVCALRPVGNIRTSRPFEFTPMAVPESGPRAVLRFLLKPDGTWADITSPERPVGGKMIYKNGVASLATGNGTVLRSFAWGRDARGTEYLVEETAGGLRGHVCRKIR